VAEFDRPPRPRGCPLSAHLHGETPPLIGVDFSSRPSARKPIVMAQGEHRHGAVVLSTLRKFHTLPAFGEWLQQPGHWVGGFDFPFGLPRALVEHLHWPTDWLACMQHYTALPRAQIRDTFAAYCAGRPAGSKFAHRACDRPAGSSPSMKWVNPPVAYMLHAGVPLLLAAGVHLPALHAGDERRVALEAYPGLLARELVGPRSYKSDDSAKHTEERLLARLAIVDALGKGRTRLGLSLQLDARLCDQLVDDASGDTLDAVLCLMQAAWGARRPGFGLPAHIDPLEGWIVSA